MGPNEAKRGGEINAFSSQYMCIHDYSTYILYSVLYILQYRRERHLKEVCPDGMGDGLENDSKIYNIYIHIITVYIQ